MKLKQSDTAARIVIFIFPCLLVAGVVFLCLTLLKDVAPVYFRPELSEQAEVVGKRIRTYSSSGKHYTTTTYTYIVSFKFPDGAVKELEVDHRSRRNSDEDVSSPLYDAIYEGDRGMVKYQEVENIEKNYKNEDMRYNGRGFISFEKGTEYGGGKLAASHRMTMMEVYGSIILSIILLIGVLVIFAFLFLWIFKPFMKTYTCQAEVITQRPKCEYGTSLTYQATFKFPDGASKKFELTVFRKDKNSEWRGDMVNKGDTGTLIYKERKNIEKKYKDQDSWKGRRFIGFEKDSANFGRQFPSS